MLQIKARYVPRCNTSAGWLSETVPLLEGEVGIETDTYKWKIGKIKVGGDNLLTPWDELKYMGSISEYTIGNLVSIDNNGNIVDSGTKVSDLLKTETYYFDSILVASQTINSGDFSSAATINNSNREAKVTIINKKIILDLLKDIVLSGSLDLEKSLIFNTNGYNIELLNSSRIRFRETIEPVTSIFNCKGSIISRSGTQTPNLVSLSVTCSNFTINEATIEDYNSTGGCSTIAISKANNITNINYCSIKTSGYNLAFCINGMKSKQININNSTCIAGALEGDASVYDAGQSLSEGAIIYPDVEECNILGGLFSAECMSLSVRCPRLILRDAIFESCDHGVYFTGERSSASGCTFKHLKWSSLQCALLEYPFKDGEVKTKSYYTSQNPDYCNYGLMYIGSDICKARVAVHNCSEVFDNDHAKINISSNYGYLSSYLYLSNYTASHDIRVDGVNPGGNRAHLIIGKDVVYSGIAYTNNTLGNGYVDNTNYIDRYFYSIESITEEIEVDELEQKTEADITLLQKEVKDTSKMIAEANPNGDARATVSGINAVSLPKNVTQGGGKVTVEGELVKNGVSYNPETWAEWTTRNNVTFDSTGATITVYDTYSSLGIKTSFKPSTKYLLILDVITNDLTTNIINDNSYVFPDGTVIVTPGQTGIAKAVMTTKETITKNSFHLKRASNETTPRTIKLKDIRVYELPSGSQIEADATNLTADELNAKYPFIQGTKSVTKTRVKSVGKNLFDISKVATNTSVINNITYLQVTIGAVTNGVRAGSPYYKLRDYAPYLIVGQTYTLSATSTGSEKRIYLVGSSVSWNFDTSKTITQAMLDSDVYFYASGLSTSAQISSIQIERNTIATPYTPYTSSGVYLAPQELYSLPNGVKDTIDTNGVLTKRVKKDTASGIVAVNKTNYPLAKNGGQFVNYLTAGGMEIGVIGTDSTTGAGTLYYELALPVTTPNQATGTLITHPSGTVYIENALADSGLYDGGITVLNTDFPIKTLERIQKIIDGYTVDIDVSKAVVSLDKLSFTHPNLVNGDVIVFEYLYEYAGINGQAEVEYLDNQFVIADTANGKFYKYKPVITNGVITSWAVVEV